MQSVQKKKRKGCGEKNLQKREGFKPGMKERVGDGKLIITRSHGSVRVL